MKRLIVVVLVSLAAAACGTASPDAGHEMVLVEQPLIFGHGGIDSEPVKPGLTIIALTTKAVDLDMRPVLCHVKFTDLMTGDGVPLEFDSALQLQVTDSVRLVSKFGDPSTFFAINVEQPFRNLVRDAVKKRGMNEMAISSSASTEVDNELKKGIDAYIKEKGLPVALLNVTLGRANPPDAIKHQRVATAEQEQRQKTEQQAKLAEDQRKMHEESRAAADNSYREKMSLSPDQYLRLETIKMQREVCASGKCTFIVGAGNAVPTLDLHR